MPCSWATASAEVGLIASATMSTPRTCPSQPANTAVCPASAAASARAASSAEICRARFGGLADLPGRGVATLGHGLGGA